MNFIEQRSDFDFGIAKPKPLDLTENEIRFITDLKEMGKIPEMFFGVLFLPAAFFDESFDEQIFTCGEIDHAAVVVRDERHVRDAPDGDSIRNFEFTITEVGTARAQDEREIVGDMQKFAAVHAHANEQLGLGIRFEGAFQVLVFQKASDRGVSVFRRDVRDFLDRYETVHMFRIVPY